MSYIELIKQENDLMLQNHIIRSLWSKVKEQQEYISGLLTEEIEDEQS